MLQRCVLRLNRLKMRFVLDDCSLACVKRSAFYLVLSVSNTSILACTTLQSRRYIYLGLKSSALHFGRGSL